MSKNTWVLAMFVLVAVMVGGYVAFSQPNRGEPITPPKKAQLKSKVNKAKVKPNNGEELTQPKIKQDNLPNNNGPVRSKTPETKKTDIAPVDPDKGERFVEGEIKAVDRDQKKIIIEQMLDDLSQQVNPEVPLADNAVIQTEAGDITLAQVKAGDLVGIILTQEGKARAIKVSPKK